MVIFEKTSEKFNKKRKDTQRQNMQKIIGRNKGCKKYKKGSINLPSQKWEIKENKNLSIDLEEVIKRRPKKILNRIKTGLYLFK